MAVKVTFDGPNKAINVLAGVTELDVKKDLYSAWVVWMWTADNAKYDPAFTTPGGGVPINEAETQLTPSFFYIANDWQIHIDTGEQVSISTNLYPDPNTHNVGVYVKTNNSGVEVTNSFSPTVKNDLELSLEYGGVVYIDTAAETSGTEYPFGTSAAPVNNVIHAKTVGELYGIQNYKLRGDLDISNIPATLDNFEIHGSAGATVTSNGVATMITGEIHNCRLIGDMGANNEQLEFWNCHVADGVTNVMGHFYNCGFEGTFKLADDEDLLFVDCYSQIGGSGAPTLIMPDNILSENNVSMRGYKGGLLVQGLKGPTGRLPDGSVDTENPPRMAMTIEYLAGKCKLDSTNVGGSVSPRNIPYSAYTNNTNGTYVDEESLLASQVTLNEALQKIEYNAEVVFDVAGSAGTEYPVGTHKVPVNNLADALVLMEFVNSRKLHLHSDITLDQDTPDLIIEGVGGKEVVTVADINIDNCYFINVYLVGQIKAGSRFRAKECALGPVGNLTNVSGAFVECGIVGDLTLWGPYPSLFTNCFAKKLITTSDYPTVNIGDGVDVDNIHNVGFRGFYGHVKFANSKNALSEISLDMGSGYVTVEASNTAGMFRLTGLAENGYENLSSLVLDVSNLSPAAEVVNEALRKIDYGGKVVVDTTSLFTGTEYPMGTAKYPVNNLLDAHEIAEDNNLYEFEIQSNLTIDIPLTDGYIFKGKSGGEVLTFTGTLVTQSTFENAYVEGDLGGSLARFDGCRMVGVTNFVGSLWNCIILDDIALASNSEFLMRNCFTAAFSEVNENTSTPIITMGALGDNQKIIGNIKGFHGALQISNMDNTLKSITIHADSSYLIIDDTNTDGWMFVQGIKSNAIVDSSSGSFFLNVTEIDFPIDDTSKQLIRDAMALDTAETPVVGSIDERLESIRDTIDYRSGVVFDVAGSAGITFPVGTEASPVNNLADALVLMNKYNMHTLHLRSDITIDQPLEYAKVIGHTGLELVTVQNVSVHRTMFTTVYLAGTTVGQFRGERVNFTQGYTGGRGAFIDCAFTGDVTLVTDLSLFFNCVSVNLAKQPIKISYGAPINGDPVIFFRNFSGSLKISDMVRPNDFLCLSFLNGSIELEASNTDGEIRINGLNKIAIQDDTAGTLVRVMDLNLTEDTIEDVLTILDKLQFNVDDELVVNLTDAGQQRVRDALAKALTVDTTVEGGSIDDGIKKLKALISILL